MGKDNHMHDRLDAVDGTERGYYFLIDRAMETEKKAMAPKR
jgi:acetoin utilization deacetylase AcuC-like enzyme